LRRRAAHLVDRRGAGVRAIAEHAEGCCRIAVRKRGRQASIVDLIE
jgi:hypothetical protein